MITTPTTSFDNIFIMFASIRKWFGFDDEERKKLTDTELIPSQDYNMAQSFSGEDIGQITGGSHPSEVGVCVV